MSDGAIAIQGDTIQAVGPSADLEAIYTDRPQYNCSGKAIIPGFINSNSHTVLTVLRGTVEDMDVGSVYGYMVPITYVMTPDERSAFAALGCLEAIRPGTTTIVDPLRHVASYAPAMVNSGLRLFLSESAADALTLEVWRGVYEYSRAWGETFLDRTQALIEAHHMTHQGRVQCQIAAHATDNCSPWMLEQLRQLAERYQLRRTIHLAQGQGEVDQIRSAHQLTPVEYLDQNDWLGPDLVAAHWSFCSEQNIERLADTGTHMAHCPANSSRRGSNWGVKMPQIFDAGVNVALGTDNMTEDISQL